MMAIGAIFGNLLVRMPLLLAYLAGVVVTLILANRQRTSAAYLALAGFALLLFFGILAAFGALLPLWIAPMGMTGARIGVLVSLAALVVNLGSAVGIVCLILALWRGLRPYP
jgi:hypothetical protein